MLNFPLFSIRNITNIREDGPLTIIDTYRDSYILDDSSLDSDCFLTRRVLMLDKQYAHGIYRLGGAFTNLIQVNRYYRAKRLNKFVDANGKILTYLPKANTKVTWKKAKCIPSADGSHYIAICKGEPYHFIVKDIYKYLALITFQGARHIYDVSMEKPDKEIMWRKI